MQLPKPVPVSKVRQLADLCEEVGLWEALETECYKQFKQATDPAEFVEIRIARDWIKKTRRTLEAAYNEPASRA